MIPLITGLIHSQQRGVNPEGVEEIILQESAAAALVTVITIRPITGKNQNSLSNHLFNELQHEKKAFQLLPSIGC